MCGLLFSVLVLKNIILNALDLILPGCKQPKKKMAFMKRIVAHQSLSKYSGDYRAAFKVED